MKITLLCIGKTDDLYLQTGIEKYLKRLGHYLDFKMLVLPDVKRSKGLSIALQKRKEAELLMKQIAAGDFVLLLDEAGKSYTSVEFSTFLEKKMLNSTPQLTLIIGGPYGFDERLYQRADGKLSLSKMTFSHQMVRLFCIEQLYRAFTILRGEPYHHL